MMEELMAETNSNFGLTDLDSGVSTFQQCNSQEDAFLKDSVTSGVHDEVNNQVRGTLFVQVTLYFCQAHFTPTQAPRSP